MTDYRVDPLRLELARLEHPPATGIFVRAMCGGAFDNYDITYLTRESLTRWLRSRGGDNPWAEQTVCIILGYGSETPSGGVADGR